MNILELAAQAVDGPRQKDYGHPIEDFTRTAGMLNAYLGINTIGPNDVANIMSIVKLSRLRNSPHHKDSKVDLAGYARTNEMVTQALGMIEP